LLTPLRTFAEQSIGGSQKQWRVLKAEGGRRFYWNTKTGVTQWDRPGTAQLKGEHIIGEGSNDLAQCGAAGFDASIVTPCDQIAGMENDWQTLQNVDSQDQALINQLRDTVSAKPIFGSPVQQTTVHIPSVLPTILSNIQRLVDQLEVGCPLHFLTACLSPPAWFTSPHASHPFSRSETTTAQTAALGLLDLQGHRALRVLQALPVLLVLVSKAPLGQRGHRAPQDSPAPRVTRATREQRETRGTRGRGESLASRAWTACKAPQVRISPPLRYMYP